jgi:hypothetical protein
MRDDIDWTMVVITLICGGVLLLFGMGGGTGTAVPASTGSSTTSNTTSRSGTASGNQVEILSRPQFVIGDVVNCYGDGSCPDTATTTTTTSSTRVEGDRNVIVGGNGDLLCRDESTGIYSDCKVQP